MIEFKLPDLGEGVAEGQIVSVLVKEGEHIDAYQPMLEVETDKAAVEIPAPKAGTVHKINVEAGQTVHVGDVLVVIDDARGEAEATAGEEGEAAEKEPAETPRERPKQRREPRREEEAEEPAEKEERPRERRREEPAEEPARKQPAARPECPTEREEAAAAAPSAHHGPIPAAPAVRKLAREMGIELAEVEPSGPGGRVLRADVEGHLSGRRRPSEDGKRPGGAAALPEGLEAGAAELPDFTQYGSVRREAVTQIRKTIARQMTRAWLNVPRVTHCDVADVTELDANRRKLNEALPDDQAKITLTAIVLKAAAGALKAHPMVNCSFDPAAGEIVYKEYVHVGIAVDTPRGLIVPVIRDVDRKSMLQLATDLAEVAQKARDVKFEIADLRGATFTITNVGALGGTFVTPMVNFPEVAILGLGRAALQPAVRDGQIVPRMLWPLSLSFDHRVVDGADGARFARTVIDALENPLRLLAMA